MAAAKNTLYTPANLAFNSNAVLPMTEVTRVLSAIDQGDPSAAEELLPLVYAELRKLATQKLALEKPGQTLQATALVHEAYLRLVANPGRKSEEEKTRWESRGHFFAAAAEAMRRILVESARRKECIKRGGTLARADIDERQIPEPEISEDVLALDQALTKLAGADKMAAELVQLRYFAGLSLAQAAKILGVSPRTAGRWWSYARAWLRQEIEG
jgi:RNA polymerase sigma factor (TIGR02999 family)